MSTPRPRRRFPFAVATLLAAAAVVLFCGALAAAETVEQAAEPIMALTGSTDAGSTSSQLVTSASAPDTSSTGAPAYGRQAPGSAWLAMAADSKRSSRFTLTEPGAVTDLVAYVDGFGGASGSQQLRLAIYSDDRGDPDRLLAQSTVGAVAAGAQAAWVSLPLPTSLALEPGAYHLAILSGDEARVARYSRERQTGGLRWADDAFADGASDPYGRKASRDDFEVAIHAVLAPPPSTDAPTSIELPAVSGTARVGETLSASRGSWTGSPTSYGYEWRRCDSAGTGCAPIPGAVGSTYVLVAADAGATLRVAVTASNSMGSTTAESAPTVPVVAAPASGTAFGRLVPGSAWFAMGADYKRSSGFTLTEPGTVTDLVAYVDGFGAAGGSQQLQFALYSDEGGEPAALLGESTVGTVAAGAEASWLNLPVTSQVVLLPGEYHLAILSGANDRVARYSREPRADALRTANDAFADGASASYGPAARDDFETAIHALVSTAPTASAPVNTELPVVSGTARVGETLSASRGSWTGSPTGYAYEWRRCDAAGIQCAPIADASSSTYGLTSADVGATLRIGVVASNGAGSTEATSALTAVVEPLVVVPPIGCSRYASPLGSDTNSGTAIAPFRSVQRLVSSLTAGETGCLFAGVYAGSVKFPHGGITLTSVPGQWATISGSVWIPDSADDVTVASLNVNGSSAVSNTVSIQGDRVTLRNLDITNENKPGAAYNAICVLAGNGGETQETERSYDLVIERSRIHDCGDDAHEHSVYLEFTRGAIIRDSYLYGNYGYGVHLYPDAQNSLIEYNVISDNSKGCKANLTFSGEAPGDEYVYPHASSNNKVFHNMITFPACRFNVESYFPTGSLTPVGNEVAFNCVYGAPWDDFGYTEGYTQHDNKFVDPLYVNRLARDYRLLLASPCLGMGPRFLPPPEQLLGTDVLP